MGLDTPQISRLTVRPALPSRGSPDAAASTATIAIGPFWRRKFEIIFLDAILSNATR